MLFRLAQIEDIDSVMRIINEAQTALRNLNIDQWQNGYPAESDIRKDIDVHNGYVLEDETGEILAYTAVIIDFEPTYDQIFDGAWLTTDRFVVVHRMAIKQSEKRKGKAEDLFSKIIQFTKNQRIVSLKVDTHEGNIPMRNLLKKLGFSYCGIILLNSGAKRLAFELLI